MTPLQENAKSNLLIYFETLSSKEEQEAYFILVPFVNIPEELIEQWRGHFVFTKEKVWFKEIWSIEQFKILSEFDKNLNTLIDSLPKNLPNVPEAFSLDTWKKIITLAQETKSTLEKTILIKIQDKIDIRLHFRKVFDLLKKQPYQKETKDCLSILANTKIIYLNTFFQLYDGWKPEFKILKRRAKSNQKIKEKGEEPSVKGFDTLMPNLEDYEDNSHREIHIITEKAYFIVHSNLEYSKLWGVLKSSRNIQDLIKIGSIDKDKQKEETASGWRVKLK